MQLWTLAIAALAVLAALVNAWLLRRTGKGTVEAAIRAAAASARSAEAAEMSASAAVEATRAETTRWQRDDLREAAAGLLSTAQRLLAEAEPFVQGGVRPTDSRAKALTAEYRSFDAHLWRALIVADEALIEPTREFAASIERLWLVVWNDDVFRGVDHQGDIDRAQELFLAAVRRSLSLPNGPWLSDTRE